MTVLRNGYGRQVHSDVVTGKTTLHDEPLEMVFIRAPIFERIGKGIEVLAEYADKPALVQKGNIMAAAFHPELTSDTTVHRRFLELAKAAQPIERPRTAPVSKKTKQQTREAEAQAIAQAS